MHAVILVAGEGKRLLPFTLSSPKCFAPVGGKRILENALEALAKNGCRNVTIVIGHHADLIRHTISDKYDGMAINFVENKNYQSTNSMYSLSMGLQNLDEPTWVLEGDVFFDEKILQQVSDVDISWYVDSSLRHLDGAYVESNSDKVASSLQIIRDLKKLQSNQNKSIGILRLSRKGVGQLREWLGQGIDEDRINDYYDLILGDNMEGETIHVVDIAGYGWYEIDTPEDLQEACKIQKKYNIQNEKL